MSRTEPVQAVVFLCDTQGQIVRYARDDFDLAAHHALPARVPDLVDAASKPKAELFLSALQCERTLVDWPMSVALTDRLMLLHFAGAVVAGALVIVAACDGAEIVPALEMFPYDPASHALVKAASNAMRTHLALPGKRTDAILDELARLNNELVTMQRELAKAKARAETADRAKSTFLTMMSHELRTPLNAIIGFTSVILQGLSGPLTNDQTTQLTIVQTNAQHLLALISDLLDISRIEAEQLEIQAQPFPLRDSLETIVASLRPKAQEKGLHIAVDIDANVGRIVADRRRTEQVLLNLLDNAVKFTDRGTIDVSAQVEADVVIIRLTDTGSGIQPRDMERLFQPFVQLSDRRERQPQGTGLGLAICQRLVKLMGGTLQVKSTWGVGSTFTVTLPRCAGSQPSA